MYQRDHSAFDVLHHTHTDFVLVARPPGAATVSVPADRHYLDIHLGKSDATYVISDLPEIGTVAPASSYVFLPAGQEREITASRSGWSIQLSFEPRLINPHATPQANGADTGIDGANLRVLAHTQDDSMVSVAKQLAGLWEIDLPLPTEKQIGAVATLLILRLAHHVLHVDPGLSTPSTVSTRIQLVLDHIEADLRQPHRLKDLASVAGVSPYHFSRMFRRAVGKSPRQYVIERRVAHAKRRLNHSDDPLVAIAYDCGFGSQSHMTDVFSKTVGATPGSIRRRAY